MKTLASLSMIACSILVSVSAFAKSNDKIVARDSYPVSRAEKQTLIKTISSNVMVKAQIAESRKLGAKCSARLLSAVKDDTGIVFEAIVDCHFPDGDDVGGGSTLLNVKGETEDPSLLLSLTLQLENVG